MRSDQRKHLSAEGIDVFWDAMRDPPSWYLAQLGSQAILEKLLPYLNPTDAGQLVLTCHLEGSWWHANAKGSDDLGGEMVGLPAWLVPELWPLLLDNASFSSAAFFVFLASALRDEAMAGSSELHSWVLRRVCLRNSVTRVQSFWLLQQDHTSVQHSRLLRSLVPQLLRLERLRLQVQLESIRAISRLAEHPDDAAVALAPGQSLTLPFQSRGLSMHVLGLTDKRRRERNVLSRVRVCLSRGVGAATEEAELVIRREHRRANCRAQALRRQCLAQLANGSRALLGEGQTWPCSQPISLGDQLVVHLRRNLTPLSDFETRNFQRGAHPPNFRVGRPVSGTRAAAGRMMRQLVQCHHGGRRTCCLPSREHGGFFTFVLGTRHVLHGTRVRRLIGAFIDVFRKATAFVNAACSVLDIGEFHADNVGINDQGQLQLDLSDLTMGRSRRGKFGLGLQPLNERLQFEVLKEPILSCMGASARVQAQGSTLQKGVATEGKRFSWRPWQTKRSEKPKLHAGGLRPETPQTLEIQEELRRQAAFEKALAPFVHDARQVAAACPPLLACLRILPCALLQDAGIDCDDTEARIARLHAPDLAARTRLDIVRQQRLSTMIHGMVHR
jgi:hypothetical protein